MTQDQPILFNPDHLRKMNDVYQARLKEEPGDIPTRVALSWCLLFQALYDSHQQAFWQDILAAAESEGEQFHSKLSSMRTVALKSKPESHTLLKDSLLQASTASQLCIHPMEKVDATKIQELVAILGEGRAVVEVEKEASQILHRLTRAIYSNKGEHLSREEEEEA